VDVIGGGKYRVKSQSKTGKGEGMLRGETSRSWIDDQRKRVGNPNGVKTLWSVIRFMVQTGEGFREKERVGELFGIS